MSKLLMAATCVAAVLSAAAANASTPHPFKNASISWVDTRGASPVVFVGHDGEMYTQVEGNMSTKFRVKAGVKTGHRIYGFVVSFTDPDGLRGALPPGSAGAMDGTYDKNLERTVSFSQPLSGIAGLLAVNACKSAFPFIPEVDQTLPGVTQITVYAGFSAGDWEGGKFVSWGHWYPDGAESRAAIATTQVPVKIVCRGKSPEPRAAELPPKPLSIDLRVKQAGETCPKKTEVTGYVDFAEKTTVRLRALLDGKPSRIETVATRQVTLAGKTWHRAEHTFTYFLDPGPHAFQIEVVDGPKSRVETVSIDCPPFKVISTWLKYDVEDKPTCPKQVVETATFKATRPGTIDYEIRHQGRLVVFSGKLDVKREGMEYVAVHKRNFTIKEPFEAQMMADVKNSPANSGWVTLKIACLKVLSGTLDLRDPNGQACPRKAEAALSIRTNEPGAVPYTLDCTGGRSWSRTANAVQTGPGTFIAVDVLPFDITKNEQVTCALKSRLPGQEKVLAIKGRQFTCIKRNVEPGTTDLTVPPRPGVPVKPQVVITTTPVPQCTGGFVRADQCFCPRNAQKTPAGPNAWRCVTRLEPVRPSIKSDVKKHRAQQASPALFRRATPTRRAQ